VTRDQSQLNKGLTRGRWLSAGAMVTVLVGLGVMLGADAASETPATATPASAAATPATPQKANLDSGAFEAARYDSEQYNQRSRLLARGKDVYNKYCVGCHGANGDGKGPAAERLITKPRDFTSGIYKFRSTDSSSLPLEADLHRTITRGLAHVSMPGFPLMPEHEKVAVIQYIKAFYPTWDEDAPKRKIVPVPSAPDDLKSAERAARGRVVYLAMQCGKCHGSDGAGKGATESTYKDAWGNDQKAFNFTRGRLKGGDDPEDIYRTFHTGLRSIMPSFGGQTLGLVSADSYKAQASMLEPGEGAKLEKTVAEFPADYDAFSKLSSDEKQQLIERNSWDLVSYIVSIRKSTAPAAATTAEAPAASATAKP